MPTYAISSQDDLELQLVCAGCGVVLGLDRRASLVQHVRPFVEEHRTCPGASPYDVDREMRTAFKMPA